MLNPQRKAQLIAALSGACAVVLLLATVTIVVSHSNRTVLGAVYPPFMRTQALNQANQPWNLAQESPRLQKAERAKYFQGRAERYYRGEDHHLPYPSDESWQMPYASQGRMQGLYQDREGWNLDGTSGRLATAEKAKYYQIRKERFQRGESGHGPYPSDETWQMPHAQGRMQGLYQEREGWNLDGTSGRLAKAEKDKYYQIRKERYVRGETSHNKYPRDETWHMPRMG